MFSADLVSGHLSPLAESQVHLELRRRVVVRPGAVATAEEEPDVVKDEEMLCQDVGSCEELATWLTLPGEAGHGDGRQVEAARADEDLASVGTGRVSGGVGTGQRPEDHRRRHVCASSGRFKLPSASHLATTESHSSAHPSYLVDLATDRSCPASRSNDTWPTMPSR